MIVSSVFFVSDLHLGHRTILKHTEGVDGAYRGGTTTEEHDEWVINQLLSVGPNKHTYWWILGDVAMNEESLRHIGRLPGRKRLIMGNHDNLSTSTYLGYFERIDGMVKKYGFWITHAPIHPIELRGKPNLHGHMHRNELRDDPRYFNTTIEWLPSNKPISLEELREGWLLKANGWWRDPEDAMSEADECVREWREQNDPDYEEEEYNECNI